MKNHIFTGFIIISLALAVFSGCGGETLLPEIPDEPVGTTTPSEITTTTPATTAKPEPIPERPVFYTHDDGVVEINLSKLLTYDIGRIKALDDRYFLTYQWEGTYSVIDTAEQKIVYTDFLPGTMRSEFESYSEDGKNGAVIYTSVDTGFRVPDYEEGYYVTYIFPDNSWTDSLGDESTRTIIGNRILRHFDGGIYEDINGELIELLPPLEEFNNIDEDGYWIPNFLAVYYSFREQIDENKFIYNRGGYEWTWGFGVYDFTTGQYTDMPDTNSLYVMGIKDNIVFTQFSDLSPMFGLYATNIDTLETVYFISDDDFPREYRGGLTEADERYTAPLLESFVMSPDKQLIAVVDYNLNVYIINADTGALKQTISVDVLYKGDTAVNSIYVDFLGNDKIIVFDSKWYMRDQRALIIPLDFN